MVLCQLGRGHDPRGLVNEQRLQRQDELSLVLKENKVWKGRREKSRLSQ